MFVHLHVHSHYSFLDSTLRVEDIVEAARRAKMPAVALTDTNGLYAAVPFIKACQAAGIRPIVGAEIDGFDPGEVMQRLGAGQEGEAGARRDDPACPLRAVVLARDRQGYAAISRLITQRRLLDPIPEEALSNSERSTRNSELDYGSGWAPDAAVCFSPGPAFEDSLLESFLALPEDHVFILTDSPALLRLLAGRPNVYAELILTKKRRAFCRRIFDLAQELNLPTVATGDVHFLRREDFPLYRLLRAIEARKTLDTLDDPPEPTGPCPPYLATDEHFFRTPAEMSRAFRALQAPLRNTLFIAERCDLDLALGQWKFPRVTLPPGETAFSQLWKITFEDLKRRYRPLTPAVTRRLEHELEIIANQGFCEYFLAVNEIVREARRRGFLVLGRGSAANSIVSYALGLTPNDPLRLDLYFERFLNPERRTPPDIDLDFSWKQRDRIVRWIFDHFGHDRVALISTHITLQPRQAIREAGKASGLPESEVNRFTRPIPCWIGEGQKLADLPVVFPECRDLPIDQEPWRTVVAGAQRILDFPRHLSIHCGGVLISPDPIADWTPLQRAAKGTIITQMEMHAVEDLGLIKMDILGNRSLGVFHDCLEVLTGGRDSDDEEDSIDAVWPVYQAQLNGEDDLEYEETA